MNYDDLISAATEVGYLLLRNGAEIYRVEDSMQRIFRAYGVDTGEIFAIPTCIFVTITTPEGKSITRIKRLYTRVTDLDKVDRANDLCRRICRLCPDVGSIQEEIFAIPTCIFVTITTPEGKSITRIKRLYTRVTDLDKVDRANDLCRRICRLCPDVGSIQEEIETINRRPVYDFGTQVAAFAMVAFSFTLFYGGTLADAFCSLFCGAGVKLVNSLMGRFQANAFFTNIVASCTAAAIAMFAVQMGFGANLDKIIIGALMNLVPGIVITIFMRDIMAGDLIAGLIRFVESLLVATAIAIGAGIALMVPRLIWGV